MKEIHKKDKAKEKNSRSGSMKMKKNNYQSLKRKEIEKKV